MPKEFQQTSFDRDKMENEINRKFPRKSDEYQFRNPEPIEINRETLIFNSDPLPMAELPTLIGFDFSAVKTPSIEISRKKLNLFSDIITEKVIKPTESEVIAELRSQLQATEQVAARERRNAQLAEARATIAESQTEKERSRADLAEAKLATTQTENSSLQIRIDTANGTIRTANTIISKLRRQAEHRVGNATDPQGLFASLGLVADAFRGLTDQQIAAMINSIHRIIAHRDHSDKGGSDEAMIKLNRAKDVLSDPHKRENYLNQTGEFDPRRR